ncbi:hypothetical protein K443DRAFT_13658 [Laccaria amethystina LaAM-08-1]|uniref:Uncharacterized protein n=1 Tax=Laccaria amethystina LaAM-08-1 TaxID=1095629 RepID=A0A0C9X3Y4_9AGAR|nr:hypothetical protein K443DRAFT_13658 [Laccaria amethystina LaAM-08-1]
MTTDAFPAFTSPIIPAYISPIVHSPEVEHERLRQQVEDLLHQAEHEDEFGSGNSDDMTMTNVMDELRSLALEEEEGDADDIQDYFSQVPIELFTLPHLFLLDSVNSASGNFAQTLNPQPSTALPPLNNPPSSPTAVTTHRHPSPSTMPTNTRSTKSCNPSRLQQQPPATGTEKRKRAKSGTNKSNKKQKAAPKGVTEDDAEESQGAKKGKGTGKEPFWLESNSAMAHSASLSTDQSAQH